MQCTVGAVPLEWYKAEKHIGYDREAKKLAKRERRDRLEELLARADSGAALRTIYDEYNDEEIVLARDEIALLQRIREGKFPHVEVCVKELMKLMHVSTDVYIRCIVWA